MWSYISCARRFDIRCTFLSNIDINSNNIVVIFPHIDENINTTAGQRIVEVEQEEGHNSYDYKKRIKEETKESQANSLVYYDQENEPKDEVEITYEYQEKEQEQVYELQEGAQTEIQDLEQEYTEQRNETQEYKQQEEQEYENRNHEKQFENIQDPAKGYQYVPYVEKKMDDEMAEPDYYYDTDGDDWWMAENLSV